MCTQGSKQLELDKMLLDHRNLGLEAQAVLVAADSAAGSVKADSAAAAGWVAAGLAAEWVEADSAGWVAAGSAAADSAAKTQRAARRPVSSSRAGACVGRRVNERPSTPQPRTRRAAPEATTCRLAALARPQ